MKLDKSELWYARLDPAQPRPVRGAAPWRQPWLGRLGLAAGAAGLILLAWGLTLAGRVLWGGWDLP